jgi:hypothetical protein
LIEIIKMHFNIMLCFWAHLDSCSLLWTHFRGAALTEVDSPFINTRKYVLPWDPFRLDCFRALGTKTFEILFVMVVPSA